jgi:PAS domain S-box-containing protein
MSRATDRLVNSEQKPAEPCLPLDERQLEALFAGIGEAVYIESLASRRIIFWTPGATALFGYDSTQTLHRRSDFLRAGDTQTEVVSNFPFTSRWRYRKRDGVEFNADVTISLLAAETGDCAVVAVQPCIGDRAGSAPGMAQAEWDLPSRGEQAIGRLLRNIAAYAVFTTDTRGNISEWNEEASRLFGYSRSEIFGKHVSIICPDDATSALQKTFDDAKEQGTSRYYQWMQRKDGGRFYARVVAFALWDDTRVQGFLFLLREDSVEPSLRQMLREKEQMAAIGTAASMLAHEIGNPLNGISATVQLLEHFLTRQGLPSTELLLSSVHDLKSEVRRLTALLNGFKNIAGPQKLALAPVDFARLFDQLTGLVHSRSVRQNVEVIVECESGLPTLNGDDDKLKQALLQVFENALDAMPHGGRLSVKAYQTEQAICIDVIDTGVGIPKNLKVFDLFSTTKPDGIGLGLFLVQQIVLAHGGTITYSSTPGQGTTFHVTFMFGPPSDPRVDFLETI